MELFEAASFIEAFVGQSLALKLAQIELALTGPQISTLKPALPSPEVVQSTLVAAHQIKRIAGQVHVLVHALGILQCLPRILEPDETVEYVSLGAGNTGKAFDLETNLRVAEFKFISWRGGSEAIRQDALFKDFYLLAEHVTDKRKCLYVVDVTEPVKFLNSKRQLSSVLSRNVKLRQLFLDTFGNQYSTVRDYYLPRQQLVELHDVGQWLP